MNLLTKFESKGFNVVSITPSIVCTAFEDNSRAIEFANIPKMYKRTKYINLLYYHFHEHIIQNNTVIEPTATSFQMSNIFTKS